METTQKSPAELLDTNSNYVKITKTKIADTETVIGLLNNRKSLIEKDKQGLYAGLTEFEANEKNLLLVRTNVELANYHSKLIQTKAEMEKYIKNASEIIVEMDEKWSEVIAKAKQEATRKENIKAVVDSMKEVDMEENIDVKMNYYLQLRDMVKNNGATMRKA